MQIPELAEQLEARAKAEREAGGYCDVNSGLSYVDVVLSDGSTYFFQGEEAEALIAEVPEWIDEEDYILAIAQNW